MTLEVTRDDRNSIKDTVGGLQDVLPLLEKAAAKHLLFKAEDDCGSVDAQDLDREFTYAIGQAASMVRYILDDPLREMVLALREADAAADAAESRPRAAAKKRGAKVRAKRLSVKPKPKAVPKQPLAPAFVADAAAEEE